jgi:hypothetical protein
MPSSSIRQAVMKVQKSAKPKGDVQGALKSALSAGSLRKPIKTK